MQGGEPGLADKIDYKTTGDVAVLSLAAAADGGPGALDVTARSALIEALERAAADTAVAAVVITGQGRGFPGGVPVEEIANEEERPSLGDLCRCVAESGKPVVVALRGEVADGGLALALAAHARLASAGTRLVLADIRRGLVPGGGATQRLPKLVGAGPALDMVFAGRMLGADSGRLRGLFRRVVPRDVVGTAVAAASEMAAEAAWQAEAGSQPGLSDPMGYQAEIARRREMPAPLPPEAEAALKCIEAAQLLPLEAGLAMEDDLRDELRRTARAKGLIRTTALEARTGPVVAAAARMTVLGDGPAAFSLVRRGLAGGLAVAVAEQRAGGAETLIRRMAAQLDHEVKQGRLAASHRDDQMARLTGGAAEPMLGAAEIVVEACAAPEDAVEGLRALMLRVTGAEVPLILSSGVGLAAGDMGELLGGRVIGVAVSETQQRGGRGLAELTGTTEAGAGVAERAGALMRRLGFACVEAAPRNGLIAQRLKAAMLGAAEWCVAQGAAPPAVDAAMGWPLGPFHQADIEGLEVQATRFEALRWPDAFGALFAAFTVAGRSGRTVGRGVFAYAQHGASGDYDAASQGIVAGWRGTGDQPVLSAAEIRRRVWTAMFSTGLRLLDEGVAGEAGAIDLAALEALGLPRASGGPMKTGEIRGLIAVRRELTAWQGDAAALWRPSDRLTRMIKNGEGFGF